MKIFHFLQNKISISAQNARNSGNKSANSAPLLRQKDGFEGGGKSVASLGQAKGTGALAGGGPSYTEPEYMKAVYEVYDHFNLLDTANGKGGKDGRIRMEDLNAAENRETWSPALRDACRFFREHPDAFERLETAAGGKQGNDGIIGRADVNAIVDVSRSNFDTPDAAAEAALWRYNSDSIRDNLEYAGLIYKTADGKYGFTEAAIGTLDKSYPWTTEDAIPEGATEVGFYHTHGDYSREDGTRTTKDNDYFGSDKFSYGDFIGFDRESKGKTEYHMYLGTPSGVFLAYDPQKDVRPYTL